MPNTVPTNVITSGTVIPPGLPAGAAGGTRPFYFQQPISIRKDDSGISTKVPYESSDFNQLYPLLNQLNLNETAYDYQSSFGKAQLAVTLAYDFVNSTPQTYVQPLWEFFDQKVEKDFLTADMPIGSQGGTVPSFGQDIQTVGLIDAADANLIRVAQQQQQAGYKIQGGWFLSPTSPIAQTPAAGVDYPPLPPFPLLDGTGQLVSAASNPSGCFIILQLMLRGQTSFPVFAPVLRFTQTVTSQYAIQASLLNARRIISSGTMPLLENIPNGLLFNLPNDSNPPIQYITQPNDLVYGWFKSFPTIRQIARLKWNIVQEWQYGLWPVAIYGELL